MEWLEWQKLAGLGITLLTAAGGVVGIVGLLKKWFPIIDDKVARGVSWAVTALMAFLSAVVSNEITPELFANPVDAVIVVVMILLGVARFSAGIYTIQK